MSIIIIWQLKSVAGQLSDRQKIFAGQNENLPVLSDSPAVFTEAEFSVEKMLYNLTNISAFFIPSGFHHDFS